MLSSLLSHYLSVATLTLHAVSLYPAYRPAQFYTSGDRSVRASGNTNATANAHIYIDLGYLINLHGSHWSNIVAVPARAARILIDLWYKG
jgi:hypothetical protein